MSTQQAAEEQIDSRNLLCPIPSCGNFGGRGYRRNRISTHLMGQHPADLNTTSKNYSLVSNFLKPLDRRICVGCDKIYMRITEDGFCITCDKKRPAAKQITRDLSETQRERFVEELKSIQETKFMFRRTVPRKLCTLWSDLLTDIALGMADAAKETEAWKALRRYLMVKAVLIQPLGGGGGHHNRNVNLTQKLMSAFYKGNEDEVWRTSLEMRTKGEKTELLRLRRDAKKRAFKERS